MKYVKPEIAVLGDAKRVIEILGKVGSNFDSSDQQHDLDPAYDLDE